LTSFSAFLSRRIIRSLDSSADVMFGILVNQLQITPLFPIISLNIMVRLFSDSFVSSNPNQPVITHNMRLRAITLTWVPTFLPLLDLSWIYPF
jgi:hypothetical protein